MLTNLTASAASMYVESHLFIIGLIIIVLMNELIMRMYARRLRTHYTKSQEGLTDDAAIEELAIEYYSKKQRTIFARTTVVSAAVLLSISYYDIRAFSFFAVALGAVIMAFKETVVSMLSYFHILRNYHIGDDIQVNGVRGEILNVRPTVTSILGKSEDGEYNGKVTVVQNFQFIMNPVEKKEMKRYSYMLTTLSIPFIAKDFNVDFVTFVEELKKFLHTALPLRGLKNVGYYRSYAGVRYKITYTYDADARVIIHITFVSKPRPISDRKERIIAFTETFKKQ